MTDFHKDSKHWKNICMVALSFKGPFAELDSKLNKIDRLSGTDQPFHEDVQNPPNILFQFWDDNSKTRWNEYDIQCKSKLMEHEILEIEGINWMFFFRFDCHSRSIQSTPKISWYPFPKSNKNWIMLQVYVFKFSITCELICWSVVELAPFLKDEPMKRNEKRAGFGIH